MDRSLMFASWAPTIIDNESFTKSFGTSYGHIEICFQIIDLILTSY